MEAFLAFCLVLLGFVTAQYPAPAVIFVGGAGYSHLGETAFIPVSLSVTPDVGVNLKVSPSFQTGAITVTQFGSPPPHFKIPTSTFPLGTHNLTIYYPGDSGSTLGKTYVKWTIIPTCSWLISNPYAELNNQVVSSAPASMGWTMWSTLCPDGTLKWLSINAGGFAYYLRDEFRDDPLKQELNFGKGCGFAPTSIPNLPTSPVWAAPDPSCPNPCKVSITWNATTPIGGNTTLTWTGYLGPDNYSIIWMDISPVSLNRIQSSDSDVKNYFGRLGVPPVNAPDLAANLASPGVTTIAGNCPTVTPCVGTTGDCPENLAVCSSTTIGITSCPATRVGGRCEFACTAGTVHSGASYATCRIGGAWSYSSCILGQLQLTTSHGDWFQYVGLTRTFNIGLPCGHPYRAILWTEVEVQTGLVSNGNSALTSYDGGFTTAGSFALGSLPAGLHKYIITYAGDDLYCPFTSATQYYFVAPTCTIRVQANATLAYGVLDYGDFQVGGNVWEFIGTKCADGIGIQWQAFFDPSQTQAQIWPRDKFIGQYVLQSQLFGKCGVAPYMFPTLPTVFSQWHAAYDASTCPVCLVNVTWAVTTAIEGMSGTLNFKGGLCADGFHISWNQIVGTQTLFRGLLSPAKVAAYLGSCGVAPTNAPNLPLNISDINIQLVPSLSGACPSVPSPAGSACASKVVEATTCPSGSLGDICYYQCSTSNTPSGVDYVFCQQDGNWSASSCIPTTSQVSTTIASHVAALCASGGELVEYVGVLCFEGKPWDIRWDAMDDITNPGGGCHWHRNSYVGNPSWLSSWVGDCGVSPTSVVPYPPSPNALAPEVTFYYKTTGTHSLNTHCGSETTSSVYAYSGNLCNALGDIVWSSFYIPNNTSCREDREISTLNVAQWFGSCGVAPSQFPSMPTRVTPSGYLGCYTDTATRVMPSHTTSGSNTIAYCASSCASAGTTYFGLQNGNECWCGNQYATYGLSTACTYACSGDSSQICGGPWANSVYHTFTALSSLTLSASVTADPTGYRPIPINLQVAPPAPSIGLTETTGCPLVFEWDHENDNGIEITYFPMPASGPWKLAMDMRIDGDGELVATGPCDSVPNIAGWQMYRTSGNIVLQFNRGHPAIQSVYVWSTGLALTTTATDTGRHLITLEYNGVDMLLTVDGASSLLNNLGPKNISVASNYPLRIMRNGCLFGGGVYAGEMRTFKAYTCIDCGSYSAPSGYSVVGSCTDHIYPSLCQFSCVSPKHLVGENTVFCGANSQWTYKGQCVDGCAPDISAGPHAVPYQCDAQISNGATCNNQCNTGYSVSSGSLTRTCSGGALSAIGYTCSATTCSYSTTLPAHSHVVSGCTTFDAYLSTCQLACDTGYYGTAGSASLTCSSPGAHAYTLVCSPITCAESNTLPSGSEIVSGCTMADAYNSHCILKCSNGFSYTSGSYDRTCNLTASGSYPTSNLVCTAFTPKNVVGTYTNGYNVQLNGIAVLVYLPDGATNYFGTFTDSATHLEVLVSGVTKTGTVYVDGSDVVKNITWTGGLGTWVKGAPVPQPYTYPPPITTVADGGVCFQAGLLNIYPYNFCTYPGSCYYRRTSDTIWENQRGVCLHQCNATVCPTLTGFNKRGVDKYCNPSGGCSNYAALGATCGGYDGNLTALAPLCDWKSVCLNQGTGYKCANSTCLNNCRYGTYCYTTTTTSDTAVCGGYEVPAFDPTQYGEFLDIYVGYEPGDPLQSRKQLLSQVGASLIGPLPCTPGTSDCGLSATCLYDTKFNAYSCASPGLNKGAIPDPPST